VKTETLIFGICSAFFIVVAPLYWFMSYDPTGTAALTMTALLCILVAIYLGVHASRMQPRPEDLPNAEIADGAGELGFFPPYSWWPLWAAGTLAFIVFGIAMGAWWLAVIGFGLGAIALCGWIFEYYVGEHAH
jgi:hypothetical protein